MRVRVRVRIRLRARPDRGHIAGGNIAASDNHAVLGRVRARARPRVRGGVREREESWFMAVAPV